jgi:hypothetical protein
VKRLDRTGRRDHFQHRYVGRIRVGELDEHEAGRPEVAVTRQCAAAIENHPLPALVVQGPVPGVSGRPLLVRFNHGAMGRRGRR